MQRPYKPYNQNLIMEFIYQEYQPSGSLTALVDCYWSLQTTGSRYALSPEHRCLPSGMAELIIHQDDNCAYGMVGNQLHLFPPAMLVGIMREPLCWQMRGGSTTFGMRLKPEGVIGLFRASLADLCNCVRGRPGGKPHKEQHCRQHHAQAHGGGL
jgi:hypothetical protein